MLEFRYALRAHAFGHMRGIQHIIVFFQAREAQVLCTASHRHEWLRVAVFWYKCNPVHNIWKYSKSACRECICTPNAGMYEYYSIPVHSCMQHLCFPGIEKK